MRRRGGPRAVALGARRVPAAVLLIDARLVQRPGKVLASRGCAAFSRAFSCSKRRGRTLMNAPDCRVLSRRERAKRARRHVSPDPAASDLPPGDRRIKTPQHAKVNRSPIGSSCAIEALRASRRLGLKRAPFPHAKRWNADALTLMDALNMDGPADAKSQRFLVVSVTDEAPETVSAHRYAHLSR